MRLLLIAAVLGTVLAGCSDDAAVAPAPAPGPPAPEPPASIPAPPATAWFNFSLTDQEYEQNIQRYQLTALAGGVADILIDGAIGAFRLPSNCAVGAVHVLTAAGETVASGGAVFWAAGDTTTAVAAVAGQGAEIALPPSSADGGEPAAQTLGTSIVLVGGDRIIVELGGNDPILMDGTYASDNGTAARNFLNVSVATRVPVDITALAGREVRCGAGTSDLDTYRARVEAPRVEVALTGRVAMNTTHASTLLYVAAAGPGAGINAAEVSFLDQSHADPTALSLSAASGGPIEVLFHRWANVGTPNPLWLLADVHWPFVAALES